MVGVLVNRRQKCPGRAGESMQGSMLFTPQLVNVYFHVEHGLGAVNVAMGSRRLESRGVNADTTNMRIYATPNTARQPTSPATTTPCSTVL